MARLIDADALLKDSDKREGAYGWIFSAEDIRNAPTIEAEPMKYGKWMQDKVAEIQYRYNCSECGSPIYDKIRPYKYCPHCGARMDGEAE